MNPEGTFLERSREEVDVYIVIYSIVEKFGSYVVRGWSCIL
jgi:hypothetical protein